MKTVKFLILFLVLLSSFFSINSTDIPWSARNNSASQYGVNLGEFADYNNTNIDAVQVGHGIRKAKSLDHNKISELKRKYEYNPILSKAFAVIDGADLAVAHDINQLVKNIKSSQNTVNESDVYDIMERDKTIITDAAECFDSGKDPEKVYRPFIDLLHTLGSQKEVKGYKGRNGIKNAMSLLNKYGKELFKGEIPKALQNVTSHESIYLRLALFYIDLYKRRSSFLEKRSLTTLKTFCPVSYFGKEQYLEKMLEQTSFYENGVFYAPSNGYVKNADVCIKVPFDRLDEITLKWDLEHQDQRKPNEVNMVFADCSGFAQIVARAFHPKNKFLNDQRQMSYQLAPLYDYLVNKQMKTENLFYEINGTTRKLNSNEIGQIKKYSKTINGLAGVYEPVIDPLANIKPGDIIIERGAGEGHVMIAVEHSLLDKHTIFVVELTSFKGTGYNWTSIKLGSHLKDGTTFRVLRIVH